MGAGIRRKNEQRRFLTDIDLHDGMRSSFEHEDLDIAIGR